METQAPSDSGYFRWRASENAPPVALSRTVMAAIQRNVLAAFQPRGPENRGLLLGYRDAGSGEFIIDDFETLPPEDECAGAADLRNRVSSRLIGIYRTQTRPGLAVSPRDCAVVEELLPRHEGVLLLVKPLSATECIGAFFLCDGGMVVDEAATEREFPFAAPVLAAVTPKPLISRKWLKALVPVTATAAGVALAMFIHTHREHAADESPSAFSASAPPIPEAPVALKAIAEGSVIHVSWNPRAASIQDAPDAILTVSDGARASSVRLKESDLRKGSLDWRPATRNVTFQMKVNRANAQPLTEFARAATANDPINSSSALPAPKPSPLAAASAGSGEQEEPVKSAAAPETVPLRRRRQPPRALLAQRRQPGPIRRVFGSITSKASHLWPFRSAKQD